MCPVGSYKQKSSKHKKDQQTIEFVFAPEIVFFPECEDNMELVGITPDQVVTTIKECHRGLISEGFNRVVAAHWFSDDYFILVESVVTKSEFNKEKTAVRIEQIAVGLAIKLPLSLPAGTVSRDMRIAEILRIVAESFGVPVTCHPDFPPVPLYSGAWDGKKFDIKFKN